jgi:GntR family transcriptional regulator
VPSLNTRSPIPLYHQLADWLLAGIRAGEFAAGSRIPSEPELARTFGIGRPTVRQATELLIRRRRLERRRGSGTFVVEPPEQVDLFSLTGTMASFRRGGIDVRTRLLKRPRIVRVGADSENPFAHRDAYHLVRLSRVRREPALPDPGWDPVLLEEIYLDPAHFAGLESVSLAGRSLSQLIDEQFHLRPESANQNFRIYRPDPERAKHLGLGPNDVALLVKRFLHFPRAHNAIYAELYCRTDQLVFSQTLSGPETIGTGANREPSGDSNGEMHDE